MVGPLDPNQGDTGPDFFQSSLWLAWEPQRNCNRLCGGDRMSASGVTSYGGLSRGLLARTCGLCPFLPAGVSPANGECMWDTAVVGSQELALHCPSWEDLPWGSEGAGTANCGSKSRGKAK